MHHGRFPALTRERVHIARTNRKTNALLRLAADTLHIRSKQRVHTGNANHDDGRFLFQTLHDLFHGLRNLFQMASGHNIGLVHVEIEKAIFISRERTDERRVSPAATRRNQQHNAAGKRQPRSFHAEAFRSGRVEGKRCGRAIDQMAIGNQFIRKILQPSLRQICGSIINGTVHADSSVSNKRCASARKR